MGAVVRRGVGFVVVVVAAVLFFGCSDGEPSAEAIAEAEELALAALLTEGDLPEGDWEVVEFGLETAQEAIPPANSIGWPRECEESRPQAETPDGVIALQVRTFSIAGAVEEGAAGSSRAGLGLTVMVFEDSEALERATSEQGNGDESQYALSEACLDARAAAGVTSESRSETPRYELPDANANRTTTLFATPTLSNESTMETHFFVRGRIIASYMAFGDDEPREIDHQGLLEAFEARVVEAAHGGG